MNQRCDTARSEAQLHSQLTAMVRRSAWLMPALQAARQLGGLGDWCIGAGAIRNLVWDELHGYTSPSALPDVDLAHFDADRLDAAHDAELQRRLSALLPGLPWEVTNQAAVHLWFERYFGHAVPPLSSLQEAVGSWPEYATAVGVSLRADDTLEVMAPHGLHDLFALMIRRNPARVSLSTFRQRVAQKRYTERWPRVTVIAC